MFTQQKPRSFFIKIVKEILKENLLYFLGSAGFIFWNFRTHYGEKWLYCANLYNDILKLENDDDKKKKLEIALAIDIIHLNLWSNRSFNKFLTNN